MPETTILNVAEKPSVARAMAAVWSRLPGARDGGMERRGGQGTNQVFTHNHVQFPDVQRQGRGVEVQGPISSYTMITTSVRGHLSNYDFSPGDYGWNQVDPVVLLDLENTPLMITYTADNQALERQLQQLARRAQVLILWLDCDREGEAIGDEVRTACLQGNPRLRVYRARFSTVLPNELQKALRTLDAVRETWVAAVQARSQLDLRVGAAFTRFQTLRLQRKFGKSLIETNRNDNNQHNNNRRGGSSVISYGPCQFPTLGFVVERWARIETFRPDDFWYLDLAVRINSDAGQAVAPNNGALQPVNDNVGNGGQRPRNRTLSFSWKRQRLYDRLSTLILYEECMEDPTAVVTSVQGRPKHKWRPVPLATVTLQTRASRFLRLGSETLMEAAEQLYQQGYISYPRTETEKFSPDFGHWALIQQLSTIQQTDFGAYAQKMVNDRSHFQVPRAGPNDDKAHPPISPCKAVDPATIDNINQRQVYELVVKHYLACCSRDAVGRETQLTLRIGIEEFTATGLMIVEQNWLEVYKPWERWSTGQGELPLLQIGSRVPLASLTMKQGSTSPPLPLSEAELINLMNRNGIGTDATIAQHIGTIQDREYAYKDANQRFHPTKLGIALVEGYNSMGYQLNKPDLRREMEHECNMVAEGRKTKEEVMVYIVNKMKACYQTAVQDAHKLDTAVGKYFSRLGADNQATQVVNANFSRCGLCQSTMSLKMDREARGRNNIRSKMVFCNTCQTGYGLPRGEVQAKTNQAAPVLCPICQFQVLQVSRGDGYEGNGYHVCPYCFVNPPAEHGGGAGGAFRCFNCQHPACELASGTTRGNDTPVGPCPFCSRNGEGQHMVVLRTNSRGMVLSCNKFAPGQDRCPFTIWLPKEAASISILQNNGDENRNVQCTTCPFKLLEFVWKPNSVPPHLGRTTVACIACDENLQRELRIKVPQPGQVAVRSRSTGRQRAAPQRANRRNNANDGNNGSNNNNNNSNFACYKCGNPGHFANACPQR